MNLVEYEFSSDEENERLIKLKKEKEEKEKEIKKKENKENENVHLITDNNTKKEKEIENTDMTKNGTINKKEISIEVKDKKNETKKEVSLQVNRVESNEDKFKQAIKPKDLFINTHFKDIEITEENFEQIFHLEDNLYTVTLQKKIDELISFYKSGMTINKNIEKSRDYKNPGIPEGFMKIFGINNFATNYSKEVYNPEELECLDLFKSVKNTEIQGKGNTNWSVEH